MIQKVQLVNYLFYMLYSTHFKKNTNLILVILTNKTPKSTIEMKKKTRKKYKEVQLTSIPGL